jgi:indolepyruvate ferredoxin oxidoreductase alpha subunit
VLIVEEGAPDYIEQAVQRLLRKRDVDTKIYGKDVLPMAGEYTAEVVTEGLLKFFAQSANDIDLSKPRERFERHGPAAPRSSACWAAAAAQAAGFLRRLPGASGLLGHQAARA